MLLQSHEDYIHILPAIPDRWTAGNVKGLVARGGFVIDIEWDEENVSVSVLSKLGGDLRLRFAGTDEVVTASTEPGKAYSFVSKYPVPDASLQ